MRCPSQVLSTTPVVHSSLTASAAKYESLVHTEATAGSHPGEMKYSII